MRCEQCAKFVSLEFADPEVDQLEVSEEGEVSAVLIIYRNCADCGTELKTATFEVDSDHSDECKDHLNKEGEDKHDLSIAENEVNQIEEGGGRYAKSFFGAELAYTITCACDDKFSVEGTVSDKIAASAMDEC